ncbi:MG2 domain-containing protein, partial [Pedosphaera parvula]
MRNLSWLVVLLTLVMCLNVEAGPRDAQWHKVDEAVKKGLPKTALEELEPIIGAALKDKAYGEAAKAIAKKISLEGEIQGNKPEEKITRLQAEIARAPKEIVPLLDTILAEWYWQYFQMNQWRFMQRTATAQPPGKDFTTWDLKRLFEEIDRQFQKALSAADTLKRIPVSAYDDLLVKGTLPDKYRPTLYDFIAHEALTFYTSAEQAAAKPEDAFEISADSPIFDEAEKFMAWKSAGTDTNAPAVRAISLYQDLMQFHKGDADQTAFVDVDLERLIHGKNSAVGEEKDSRFRIALKRFIDKWGDNEISAEASFQLASLLQQEGKLVEAREAALRAVHAFPNSPGGKECRNLIATIEMKQSRIVTERVWNQPLPKIQVFYRNVTKVYFRAVAYDWNQFLEKTHSRPESLNDAERKELLQKQPVLEWSADLPATTDYKESQIELPAPENLKPGFYFILASHDPAFGGTDNVVSYSDVWVSTLSLITRSTQEGLEGFVLDAISGEPLAGAEVKGWYLDNQGNRVAEPAKTTDTNGFFSLSVPQYRSYVFLVKHQGEQLGTMEKSAYYGGEPEQQFEQTVFFTDRAIYRPGQTIRYKGICLSANPKANNYRLLKGRQVKVVFADLNGKEIARQAVQCNDYGSFSGSFTAPRDRLMGMMQIRVENGPTGQANFNVEEYKRPKFQVTLDTPKEGAKLNQKVSLQGHAMSYTGAAVDGANVQLRVVREVQYPIWWGYYSWRRPMRNESSQEILHATVKTEVDGSFKVEFTAKPDLSVPEKDEPTFQFKVYADVTDSAGETRSAETVVNAGYTALKAAMIAEDWQTAEKPVDITIKATSLDDKGQVAEGSVKIYRLKQPEKVQRPPLKEYEPYEFAVRGATNVDWSDPKSWPLGEMVMEKGFTTGTNGEAQVSTKLGVGAYRALLETQDRFGKKVTALLPVTVLDPNSNKLSIKIPNVVAAPAWTLEPGAEMTALWGTGYDEGRAMVEIEHRHKIIRRYWTKPGQTQSLIRQAVSEEMRGGFTLHVTQVRENRAYLESRRVEVPWSNKELKVTWEHFTSKMQPNQKETWTAVITGPTAQKSVAEMVATLYDESLDALRPMEWMNRFSFFYQDQSVRQAMFENVPEPFRGIKG